MYYEKQILPIDKNGHFLFAIHYSDVEVGGERTRESGHAYFAYGHIDHPEKLKDITHLCCIDRKPSAKEADYHRSCSDVQKNEVGGLERAWESLYEANLAEQNSVYVPRVALASLNGTLIISFECGEETGWGLSDTMIRFVDIFEEKILTEHKANYISSIKSISIKGNSILTINQKGTFKIKMEFVELKIPTLKKITSLKLSTSNIRDIYFLSGNEEWIGIGEKLQILQADTYKVLSEFNLPKDSIPYSSDIALEKRVVAISGDKGKISTVDLKTGKIKKYYPHRGCKRDDFAQIKLSDSGEWMASKIYHKKELVITRLTDGVSWVALELIDEVIDEKVEGKYRAQSFIPATFSFIGSRLLISDSKEVREIPIEEPQNKQEIFVSEQGKPGARIPIKIPAKATFEKLIQAAKLDRISKEIADHYSPPIKIKTKKSKKSGWLVPGKRGAPELGQSRFGGWPDLPEGEQWPAWQNRPMSFLGQINLEEVSAIQPNVRLPKKGILLFFLGCMDQRYENDETQRETYMVDAGLGIKPENNNGWKVIYSDSTTNLKRTSFEGDIYPDLFSPCLLTLSSGGMPLPDEQATAYETIHFNQVEKDNYNEVIDFLSSENWDNQLMGYPNLLQFTPPELQCELASNGMDPYSFPDADSNEYKTLFQSAGSWGLLLQFTDDNNPGFIWGDGGHFYFYGNRLEMERGDFSSVWVNFEN